MCVDYEILFSSNKLPAGLLVQAAAAAQRSLDISRRRGVCGFVSQSKTVCLYLLPLNDLRLFFYPTKLSLPDEMQPAERHSEADSTDAATQQYLARHKIV